MEARDGLGRRGQPLRDPLTCSAHRAPVSWCSCFAGFLLTAVSLTSACCSRARGPSSVTPAHRAGRPDRRPSTARAIARRSSMAATSGSRAATAWPIRRPYRQLRGIGGGFVYDPGRQRCLWFGGGLFFGNQLSEWTGTTWQNVPTAHAPTPRRDTAMAYDAARARMVLFGGWTGGGYPNDTWEFDGIDWQQASPPVSPPGMSRHRMTYDVARGEILVYSQQNGLALRRRDLACGAAGPPVHPTVAFVYDEARARTVLTSSSSSTVPAASDLGVGRQRVDEPAARRAEPLIHGERHGRQRARHRRSGRQPERRHHDVGVGRRAMASRHAIRPSARAARHRRRLTTRLPAPRSPSAARCRRASRSPAPTTRSCTCAAATACSPRRPGRARAPSPRWRRKRRATCC